MAGYFTRLYLGTPAELAIEPAIAALGVPYRTQFPLWLYGLGKFFPDFLLPTIGAVLEVDDESHDDPEKQKADGLRTSALEALGYVVVRCSNDEALADPRGTVQRLIVDSGLLHRQGPGLPLAPSRTRHRKRARPIRRGSPSARAASQSRKSPNTRTHTLHN
jgi:hypothetical protein